MEPDTVRSGIPDGDNCGVLKRIRFYLQTPDQSDNRTSGY